MLVYSPSEQEDLQYALIRNSTQIIVGKKDNLDLDKLRTLSDVETVLLEEGSTPSGEKSVLLKERVMNNLMIEEIIDHYAVIPLGTSKRNWFYHVTTDARVTWIRFESGQAKSRSFGLQITKRSEQVRSDLVAFYTRLMVSDIIRDLAGGLVQITYRPPIHGLSTSFHFGIRRTSEKDVEYSAITTGLAFNYRYRFTNVVGITLAPDVRLDLVPLSTRLNNNTDNDLYLHGQIGLRLGLDTADLLGSHQLQFAIPLQAGVIGKFDLHQVDEQTYEIKLATGLQLKITALRHLVAQVGYGFSWWRLSYSKHSLNFLLSLQM